jgi:hypothetical protein
VKSLQAGDHGTRGSANQLACLESRAALYWNHALAVLSRPNRSVIGERMCVLLQHIDRERKHACTMHVGKPARSELALPAIVKGPLAIQSSDDYSAGLEKVTRAV